MKLSLASGGELQNLENGIGGGPLGFAVDPILDESQTLGRLMDVVALGNVGDRQAQLPQTLEPAFRRLAHALATARHSGRPAHLSHVVHQVGSAASVADA